MKQNPITISAVKYKKYGGWVGYVRIWHNGEPVYSESCQILRSYKNDALKDAKFEKEYMLSTGKNLF
ncbi:MAG: hypothetical protein ACOYWZ_16145 [Bacillota bacterium]